MAMPQEDPRKPRTLNTYGAKGYAGAGAMPGTPQAIAADMPPPGSQVDQMAARAADSRGSSVPLTAADIERKRFAAANQIGTGISNAAQSVADTYNRVGEAVGQKGLEIAGQLFQPGPNKLNVDFSPPGNQYNAQHEIRNFNANVATSGVTPSAWGGDRYVPEQAATATVAPEQKTQVVSGVDGAIRAANEPATNPPQPAPEQAIAANPPMYDPNVANLGQRTIQEGDTRLNEKLTQLPNGQVQYDFASPNGGTGQVSSSNADAMRRVAGVSPSKGGLTVLQNDQTAATMEKEAAHRAGMAALQAGGRYEDGANAVLTGQRSGILAPQQADPRMAIAQDAIGKVQKINDLIGTTRWDGMSRHDKAATMEQAKTYAALAAGFGKDDKSLSPEQRDYYLAGAEQRRAEAGQKQAEAAQKTAKTEQGIAPQYQARKVKRTDPVTGETTEEEIPGVFDANAKTWTPLTGDQAGATNQGPRAMPKTDFEQYLKENPKLSRQRAIEHLKSQGIAIGA